MKINSLVINNRNLKYFVVYGLVCLTAIYIGGFIASREVGDKLLGDKVNAAILNHENWNNVLVLIIRRISIFIVGGACVILGIWAIYKKKYEYLFFGYILTFPFASTLNGLFFSINYADSLGPTSNSIEFTSCLLILSFFILAIQDFKGLLQIFSNQISWCFVALGISGLFTQIYHLGFANGLIIIFTRVVQPLIFIILVSCIARSKQGLQKIMLVSLVSIILAIFYRVVSPTEVVTNSALERVGQLGSWTIYGTLLVASVPLAIALWITTPKLRLFIAGFLPLVIYEAYLTQTRGAIAALGTLGLFILEKKLRLLIFPLLIAFFWILSTPDLIKIELTGNRLLSLNPQLLANDANWLVRVNRNLSAMRYIEEHPFLGLGLGQPTRETGIDLAFWVYNPYLHWGVAMGIPAMLAFTYMMFLSTLNAIRNFVFEVREFKIYQLSILISLIIWIINQFTTGDSLTYLSYPEATLMFYFIIGLILGQQLERESKAKWVFAQNSE